MADKEELPGTIISNKVEMVPDIQQIKNAAMLEYENDFYRLLYCNTR